MMSNADRAMAASTRKQVCAGCPYKPQQQRSDADHGMFWAIVERAFQSWPERHPFCPTDKNELYGWLLIEANYSVSAEVQDRGVNAIRKSARVFMDLAGESDHPIYYMRLKATTRGVKVTIPKSLSKKNAGKRQFEDVRSKVYEIIETTIGVKIEDLKREARQEAA